MASAREGLQHGSRFEPRKRQQLKTAQLAKHYGRSYYTSCAGRCSINDDSRQQESPASAVLEFLQSQWSKEDSEAGDNATRTGRIQPRPGTAIRRPSATKAHLLEHLRTKSRDLSDAVMGAARTAWASVGGGSSAEELSDEDADDLSSDDGDGGDEGIRVAQGELGKPRPQSYRRSSDNAPSQASSQSSRAFKGIESSQVINCAEPIAARDREQRRRSYADGLREEIALSKEAAKRRSCADDGLLQARQGPPAAKENAIVSQNRRRHTISDCCSNAEIGRNRVLSNTACTDESDYNSLTIRTTLYSGTSISSRPPNARTDRAFPSRPASAMMSRTNPASSKSHVALSGASFSSPTPPQTVRPSLGLSRPQSARPTRPTSASRPSVTSKTRPQTAKSSRPMSAMSTKNSKGTSSTVSWGDDAEVTAVTGLMFKIEKRGLNGTKALVTRVRDIDLKRVWEQYMEMKPDHDGHVLTRTVERVCGMNQSGGLHFGRTAFSRLGDESSGADGACDAQARAGTVLKKRSSFLARAKDKGVLNFKDLLSMVYPDATVKQISDMEDLCLAKFANRWQKKCFHQHDEKHKKAVRSMYCTIKRIPDDEESYEATGSGISLQDLEDFLNDHHPDVCTIELLRTLGKGQRDRVYNGYMLQKQEFVEWVLKTDQFWGKKGGSYVYIRKA